MSILNEPRLGGIVLGSSNPERLAAWYQAAFAPDQEVIDSVLRLTHGLLIFELRGDVGAQSLEPGRIIINIEVDSLSVLEAHLSTLPLEWVRPAEKIAVGTIATVKDFDGNFVNLLELTS